MHIEMLVYRPGTGTGPRTIECDAQSTVDKLRALIAETFHYPYDEILLSISTDKGMVVLPNGASLQDYNLSAGIDCRTLPAKNLDKLNNPAMQGLLQNHVLRHNPVVQPEDSAEALEQKAEQVSGL